MRSTFPGYFTPTQEEFKELWHDSTFAFDTNVLLDLYRLPEEDRLVFFGALEKLAERIFLPYQVASEYLNKRLEVISVRAKSYQTIKEDSDKLAKLFESVIQQHSLGKGKQIIGAAKEAAQKIASYVDAAVKEEPNLLRSDDVRSKLDTLFEAKIGPRYAEPQLDKIYKDGAGRFERRVPPGYEDRKKPEPERYGDVVIWYQLIDHAKTSKKPLIFVTRDTKEDWWLEHNGDTIGPRPELVQEMMVSAGVRFYMYTTPRFLEFAQQFLDLNLEATKKAASEFEKIEKKDKKAVDASSSPAARWTTSDFHIPWEDRIVTPGWIRPRFQYTPSAQPVVAGWADYDFGFLNKASPSKTEFSLLLPINGYPFDSATGRWKADIVSVETDQLGDLICYVLNFEPEGAPGGIRKLRLNVALSRLQNDSDWRYKRAIINKISSWLGSGQVEGTIADIG
jgi:hypothetical protein